MVKDYTTKPQYIQAIKLDINSVDEINTFTQNQVTYTDGYWGWSGNTISHQFRNGDYIYKSEDGAFGFMVKKEFEKKFFEDRSVQ